MGFYEDWRNSTLDDEDYYIQSFLSKSEESLNVFKYGTIEELVVAVTFLLSKPIKYFLDKINKTYDYNPADLVQYSNFDHAITNVCSVISFSKKALTFSEIGKIIMRSKLDGACKKYGENHAKLANELSLVELYKGSSYLVKNTSLGDFTLRISNEDKRQLVKRLALRNKFIQTLIFHAKEEMTYYEELALKVVSVSTLTRRKSNIKYLVSLILEEDKEILNNIIW